MHRSDHESPAWLQKLPFWGVHAAAIAGAILVGWGWPAFAWLFVLKVLEWVGILWDVEGVPRHIRDEAIAPARVRIACQTGSQALLNTK